ncbi:RNase H1/viroplasmin domain-containing protein [Lactobacillus gasseri]|nr:RNase H1/viroplasmin domain-containing protein [Lactobacillus gasseri]WEA88509.1 RNase H1/viroplasmin domain-containing protein [Lactobacillus gasseri]
MKYYAVKKGRTPGVYRTWEDAKKQVDGFSGAEYKSFEKITDATEYLDWNKETQPDIVKEDSLSNAIKKIQAAKIVPQAKKEKNKKD